MKIELKTYRVNGPSMHTATGAWWWLNGDGYGHRFYGPYNQTGNWMIHGVFIK